MPSRQPRWPSMGLNSCNCSTRRSSEGRTFFRSPAPLAPKSRYFSTSNFFCRVSAWERTAMSWISSSRFGTNSCNGGSKRRIVTGRPSIARKRPAKSSVCSRCSSARAASKVATSSAASGESSWPASRRRLASVARVAARIMRRTVGSRSSSKNMCSVRHRPIPCAPKARARSASRG